MEKYGKITAPGTICFERLLPGPIERVWAYLTESGKRGKWLASGEMELRIGGRVELNFLHANLSPQVETVPEKYQDMANGHQIEGKVTQLDPPHLLSYTWGEATGEASEVTFALEPLGEKVLLTLTHRHLGDDSKLMVSVASGWHTHLGILIDHLANKVPLGFWTVHNQMEEIYEKMIAKGTPGG